MRIGDYKTVIIHWMLTSLLYTNRLLDTDVLVKHTSCAAPWQLVSELSTSKWGHG